MKKSLIALAVAGTFTAPTAFAATANVDVYGLLNVTVDNVDNGVNKKSRITTGNNSALGFKGSEDLGGGLKAIWQVEVNVSMDGDSGSTANVTPTAITGTTTIAGGGTTYTTGSANNTVRVPSPAGGLNGIRNTFLGLSGGFGTVLMGVHDTPYKLSTGRLDNFSGTLGDYNSIMGAYSFCFTSDCNTAAEEQGNASSQFDLRAGNVIAYVSPNLQGFQGRLGYVMSGDDDFGSTRPLKKSNAWSMDVSYTQGPLFLTAAYEKHNIETATRTYVFGGDVAWNILGPANASGGVLLLGNCVPNTTITPNIICEKVERTAWKIGGGYKFGDLSLGAIWENIDLDVGVVSFDRNAWMLNAGYAMGPVTLKAMYLKADDFDGSTDTGAKQWNLGVDYALSKRTMVQFVYAKLDNDANAAYRLSQGSNAVGSAGAGRDQDGFAIGIRHSF